MRFEWWEYSNATVNGFIYVAGYCREKSNENDHISCLKNKKKYMWSIHRYNPWNDEWNEINASIRGILVDWCDVLYAIDDIKVHYYNCEQNKWVKSISSLNHS